jgi:uncharacterized membrane protein YgdD (TMEM256/DUF423 family)
MKSFQLLGAAFLFLAMVLAAMSSHLIYPYLEAHDIRAFQTALFFQMIHALALLLIPKVLELKPVQTRVLGVMWSLGILGFCFAIFLLKIGLARDFQSVEMIGPVTPYGGALLILSWLALFVFILQNRRS